MANEIRISAGLNVNNGNLQYTSRPSAFVANQATANGPTPGTVLVPTTGVNVDLSGLVRLGVCWMQNLDRSNNVRWGVHDGALFHPLGLLKPGEVAVFRLDPDLGEEEADTGTGTTSPVNHLYLKAVGGSCYTRVDAFDE